jgi:pimeloyl-ACP methyl ester carboxylesterase
VKALLIHGAGGGAWEWQCWQPAFAAGGLESEAIELEPAAEGLAATRYEDYLAQVSRAARGHHVLIGASLGALLALEAAARLDPIALVLINPVPPAPWHRLLPPRRFPAVIPWSRTASLEGTRRAMPDAEPEVVAFAASRWRDESGAVLAAAWSGRVFPPPKAPRLVLISEADEELPPAAMDRFARDIGAETWSLPELGHLSPLLGPNAASLAEGVARWLRARARSR